MYKKRYFIGKIEHYYPAGMLGDVDAITDSKHKAVEYVLKKLMIVQLVNYFGDKHGLGVTGFYADYHIADLNTGTVYEFDVDDSIQLGAHLEKLVKKYKNNEDIRCLCDKLEKECQEQLAELDSWEELFIDSYIDLKLDVSFDKNDIEAFFEEFGKSLNSRKIEIL